MPTDDELIIRILREATEPLFPSAITDLLNQLGGEAVYTMTEVVMRLKSLNQQVEQLPDGSWMLKPSLR